MPATRTTRSISQHRDRHAQRPLADVVEIRKNPSKPRRFKTVDDLKSIMGESDPYARGLVYMKNYEHTLEPEFFARLRPSLRPEDPRPPPLNLSDFEGIKTIGYGISSKVVVARTTRNQHPLDKPGRLVALKIIEKYWLRNYDREPLLEPATKHVERSVLTELPWNPFICGLVGSFVDSQNVYLALEYCPRASLRSVMSSQPCLPPNIAQFFICGITAGLAFLHDHEIIHRDIKPENILLGPGGYPVISDFGTARKQHEDYFRVRQSKTGYEDDVELEKPHMRFDWHEMGSAPYQPPECFDIACPYYGLGVDWWAVGVVLFEMTAGRLPFYSRTEEKLGRLICKCKYEWPKNLKVGKTLKAIVAAFLTIDPFKRLGTYGCQQIMSHPWFRNIDWGKIHGRHYVSPLEQPRISRNHDKYHVWPLPEQRHVPGLRLAEPPTEVKHDGRYRRKQL